MSIDPFDRVEKLRSVATNSAPIRLAYTTTSDCWGRHPDPNDEETWAVYDPEEDDPPIADGMSEEDAEFFATFDRPTVIALLESGYSLYQMVMVMSDIMATTSRLVDEVGDLLNTATVDPEGSRIIVDWERFTAVHRTMIQAMLQLRHKAAVDD